MSQQDPKKPNRKFDYKFTLICLKDGLLQCL